MSLRVSLALSLLCAAGAASAADGCPDLTGLPINQNVQWSQVWQVLNQQAPCTDNCHLGSSPTGDLDLSSPNISIYFLVGQQSSQSATALRVEPGNPQASLFWQKVACTDPDVGTPMPPPFGGVSVEILGLIYDWIEQGAYGENTEDPIPRDYMFRDSMESLRGLPPVTVVLPLGVPTEQHRQPDLQSRGFHGGPRT
jgi:hypothetical protein